MIKLFSHLKPYALAIAGILVLVFLQSLADLYQPTLMADIVDAGIVRGDTGYILRVGGLMLLVAAGGALCAVLAGYLSARVGAGFGRDLRQRVFAQVQSFSQREFDQFGTATLITRTTNDVTQVQTVLVILFRMMVMAPLMCIGGIVMAVSKDATLSLLLVLVMPILAAIIIVIARIGLPLFRAMQVKLDTLNRVLREGLTGIRVIRAFDRTDHEQRRFQEANRDLTDTAIKVNQIIALQMPLLTLVMNLASLAIVWFGSIRVDTGHLQVGDLMAFIQYAMQIMFSLVMASMMFIMLPRAQAAAVRINEVLATVPSIRDPVHPKKSSSNYGSIEFRDVTFHYPGAEQPALSHISFRAEPGKVTAIIGGTGAGKSTLLHLILRYYDVDSGQILVDGVDVREMTQADLRAKIGFVPQRAVLFSGTIADNIRYGCNDAADTEIERAAEIAQAREFITGMPEGFASLVSRGGTNLSGGQKQRLSIARALVRRPEIYLFDDCFSALDFKTDARLRAALRRWTANATVVIVAQRVSTVMNADQIIVLDEGQIAGIGTHHQLLASCPVYREIVASQLAEEEMA